MFRWLAGALALPLGITGCGLVVFDADDDDEPSPADTTTSSSATSSATGEPSTGAAAGDGGDGGAPATSASTGAGGGGGGAAVPPPVTSCRGLEWYGETIVQPLNAQHVSQGLALEHVARADDPLGVAGSVAIVVPYAEPDPDEHEQGVQFLEAWHTWEEEVAGDHSTDAHLRDGEQHEWADPDAVPVRALAQGRGGYMAYVREAGAVVRERIPYGGFPLPSGIEGVTDLAWSDRGVYALVHGAAEAPQVDLVAPSAAPVAMSTGLVACADRAVPIDVAPLGDGFVVAAGSGAEGSCDGAPTPPARVTLTFVDDGGAVWSEREVVVDGVPGEVALLPHGNGAWLAVRSEDRDLVALMHLDHDGATTAAGDVELAAGRRIALAMRQEELVVVDTGSDPAARIRTFAPDLTPIAETPPLPVPVTPSGAPVVHVRADGGAFLVAALVREGGPPEVVTAVRARCVEEVAR